MPTKPKTERPARRPAPEIRRARAQPGERSGPRRDVLMVEVLTTAEALFATRGFASTSLQDIAKEIGLSRTSMYYYFPSKEALLSELVRGVNERTASIFAGLEEAKQASHGERVAQAARELVLWVTDRQTHFKLLDRNESELPDALAAAHRETRRRVLDGMTRLIQDGIAAGEFKPVNANLAAFAVLGMCNWTAWWFSPDGSLSRKEAADGIAGLAMAMVQNPLGTAGEAGGFRDTKALVASIRQTLDVIEQMSATNVS